MLEIAAESVHSNPWFTVECRTYRAPDGDEHRYFMVRKPDSVLAVVRRDTGYVMVELDRPTLGGLRSTEFPQGGVEPGEEPGAAVRREVLEETGLTLTDVRAVGAFAESNGMATSYCHVFTARAAGEGPVARDAFEQGMALRVLAMAEIRALARSGGVTDSATLAALALTGTEDDDCG